MFAGEKDELIPKSYATKSIDIMKKGGVSISEKWYDIGHTISEQELDDMAASILKLEIDGKSKM